MTSPPCARVLVALLILLAAPGPGLLADGFIYIPNPPAILIPVPVPVHPRPFPRPIRPSFPLEVTRHRVVTEIDDTVARTRVEETFHNPNDVQLEGVYMFPLPPDAAVGSFSMKIGGKEATGEILEKTRAREIYEGIVRQARDPGLLEYVDRGLFRASVFPIPPRAGVDVTIEYSETLAREGGSATYRYPLDTGKYSAGDYKDVVIDIRLRSTVPLRAIGCPSHETAGISRTGEREARVSLEAKTLRADKDLVLTWNVSEDALAPSVMAYRGTDPEGYFLFTVAPRPDPMKAAPPKDLVFVLDTSGSMVGEKMEQAKKALRHGVSILNAGDRFNIIDFSTEARRFREGLVEATDAEKKMAIAHVDEMKARGGTNVEEAIRFALSDIQSRDRLQMVVFISDGEPTIGVTAPAEILRVIKERNTERRRVFVFGVGEDLNAKLLDLIAKETRAVSKYVGSSENLELPLSSFFDKIDSPVLTDLTIEFTGSGVSDVYPKPLPDLFRGDQLEVFGRYTADGSRQVVLRGRYLGEGRVFEFPLNFASGPNAFLPRLWAMRKIGYLLEQIRLVGETSEVKDEVIRLSKRHGIITPYTSYLILEEDRLSLSDGSRGPPRTRFAARDALSRQAPPGAPQSESRSDLETAAEVSAARKGFEGGRGAGGIAQSRRIEELKSGEALGSIELYVKDRVNVGGERMKEVAGRAFYLQGSRWVDATLTEKNAPPEADARKVKYLSDEYFTLLRDEPGIGAILSAGSEITFLWKGRVISIEA